MLTHRERAAATSEGARWAARRVTHIRSVAGVATLARCRRIALCAAPTHEPDMGHEMIQSGRVML